MTDSWHAEVGFLERIEVINRFKALFDEDVDEKVNTDGTPLATSAVRAREEQEKCMNVARSKAEYNELWTQRLRELQDLQAEKAKKRSLGIENDIPQTLPAPEGPPTEIGPYKKAVPFASGLFSAVYWSPSLSSQGHESMESAEYVALKVTNPSQMSPPHDSRREARILEAAGGHPNIMKLLDAFNIPPSTFVIVSPFWEANLADLLDKKAVTPAKCLRIVRDIFSGLAHLHSLNILHRDIKPSNVLLNRKTGTAVIADFGIAWSAKDSASEPGDKKICDVGTTCYRAPELLFGYTSYGEAIDIWAAGCVLAECVAKDHESLFDAGDLGSELRLLASIFRKLGTPTLETWPEAAKFPDFGKIQFIEYPKKSWEELLPDGSPKIWDLLDKIFQFDSSARISAQDALSHPLLA